jgi:transposase InsO family protein
MEDLKETVTTYVGKGMSVETATCIAGISKSSYYYKPSGGPRGRRPSESTLYKGAPVSNEKVVDDIKDIISAEFIDYGYDKVTHVLRGMGYTINSKKVYRLMKENNLLMPLRRKRKIAGKKYVEFTNPRFTRPLHIIEADIKYIYIHGQQKNAFLLTFLDTCTRMALEWTLGFTMRKQTVEYAINQLFNNWLKPNQISGNQLEVFLRTDNGSQFIAHLVRDTLAQNQIQQEFIKPATPQQNAHIESFHSTVERLVCQKVEMESLEHAREVFKRFYQVYNNQRILRPLLYNPPGKFFEMFQKGLIEIKWDEKKKENKFSFSREAGKSPASLPEVLLLGKTKLNKHNNLLSQQLN